MLTSQPHDTTPVLHIASRVNFGSRHVSIVHALWVSVAPYAAGPHPHCTRTNRTPGVPCDTDATHKQTLLPRGAGSSAEGPNRVKFLRSVRRCSNLVHSNGPWVLLWQFHPDFVQGAFPTLGSRVNDLERAKCFGWGPEDIHPAL